MKSTITLFSLFLLCSIYTYAQDEEIEYSEEELTFIEDDSDSLAFVNLLDSLNELEKALDYQYNDVIIGENLATIHCDSNFKYIGPDDANKVLMDWGNPSQYVEGMLFPSEVSPYLGGWGIIITYDSDGHVEDEDAQDVDYDEILEQLQEEAIEISKNRREAGYQGYEVVGWAEQPHYNSETKRIYWAEELHFDGEDPSDNTLNYSIKVLGRRGVLTFNAVSVMSSLEEVKPAMETLLAQVEFNDGEKYTDFDPSVDEVAAYGVGALVAGKLAAKAGLLKVIGVFLAKAWKFILLGILGLIAVIKKVLGIKKKEQEEEQKKPSQYDPSKSNKDGERPDGEGDVGLPPKS